jgi:hypothetical protein
MQDIESPFPANLAEVMMGRVIKKAAPYRFSGKTFL